MKLPAGLHAALALSAFVIAILMACNGGFAAAGITVAYGLAQGVYASVVRRRALAAGNNPWWGNRPGHWV